MQDECLRGAYMSHLDEGVQGKKPGWKTRCLMCSIFTAIELYQCKMQNGQH